MRGEAMSVEQDLQTYCKAMGRPNGWETCLRIERKYALDGYPPPVVTEWMSAEAKEPGSGDAAIDRMLANDQEDPEG
jgi:hypothetical protein